MLRPGFVLSMALVLACTPGPVGAKESFKSVLKKADGYAVRRDYLNAYPLYRKAAELNPKSSEAHTGLAWMIYRTGLEPLPRAMEEGLLAVKYNPKNVTAHNILGAVYFSMGNIAAAQHEFRTVLKLDPKRRCSGCGKMEALLGKEDLKLVPFDSKEALVNPYDNKPGAKAKPK
ncbi:MAG: tetratricopeptide repeat protein [Candidatus Obscuribacterales bacterium]